MGKKYRSHKTAGIFLAAAAIWMITSVSALAYSAEELVPMGNAIGIQMKMSGVMIVGLSKVETAAGEAAPAENAGLMVGDIITELNGRSISTSADFITEVSEMDGDPVSVTVDRQDKKVHFTVTPAKNASGAYQLGLWLRDGVTGIGTMTYYDPATGTFGALGHGINDADTGKLVPVHNGEVTSAEVVDVVRGSCGTPGELCGKLGDERMGSIEINADCGVFGVYDGTAAGNAIPVATESEIVLGPAIILANVNGSQVKEYSVEISRVYRDPNDSKTVMIAVTDPELLEATGGIVQGMSGSPIIQNGKLIGAVTHVLISDPSRGYGVSIEKMLNASDGMETAA